MTKYDDYYEPLTSCGCGHPNARPPCSYCESGMWYEDEEDLVRSYREDLYSKTKVVDPLQRLQRQCDALRQAYDDLEVSKGRELYQIMSMDIQNEYTLEIRDEVYAEAYTNVYNDICRVETPKIREKLEAQIRDSIFEEVRQQILAEMKAAQDLV